ncbi:MAG: hypothetical protein KC589_10715 [Nanoarchaeota archaeon]|nr:hypothetical protein [Nanoarchaeota archaeon]
MKIRKFYNTNLEDFNLKNDNIFITFCLGNKFFKNKTNIKFYIKWALENTKDKVLLLIADKIQITNYKIRNSSSHNAILNRIERDSNELKKLINEVICELTPYKQSKIELINWKEYETNDPNYYETTINIYKFFKNSTEFKNEILKSVKKSILDRKFNDYQYKFLCDYVLDEFALCYSGIEYKNIYYKTLVYPYSDSVLEFVIKLQNNLILPKIYERLKNLKKSKTIILN